MERVPLYCDSLPPTENWIHKVEILNPGLVVALENVQDRVLLPCINWDKLNRKSTGVLGKYKVLWITVQLIGVEYFSTKYI